MCQLFGTTSLVLSYIYLQHCLHLPEQFASSHNTKSNYNEAKCINSRIRQCRARQSAVASGRRGGWDASDQHLVQYSVQATIQLTININFTLCFTIQIANRLLKLHTYL